VGKQADIYGKNSFVLSTNNEKYYKMKARWVSHRPSPQLPIVGQTIIAKWWFGRYYIVSTIELDSSSPLQKLTKSLIQSFPYEQAIPEEKFITNVYKCDINGTPKSDFIYVREYSTLLEAQNGHDEAVRQFSN
jgi:hypothetical protein